jgi:hypothetical protein
MALRSGAIHRVVDILIPDNDDHAQEPFLLILEFLDGFLNISEQNESALLV